MENKKLNRLRVVMAEKDLSNMWLSENLGVSQATVSKWVTNLLAQFGDAYKDFQVA